MAKAHAAPRAHLAADPWFDWTDPAGEPERRPPPPAPGPRAGAPPARRSARTPQRRRREEHFRRRRRDLLVDVGVALVLAIILISLTAGLGILLLFVLPLAGGLVAERVVPRLVQRRRARHTSSGHPRRGGRARRPH